MCSNSVVKWQMNCCVGEIRVRAAMWHQLVNGNLWSLYQALAECCLPWGINSQKWTVTKLQKKQQSNLVCLHADINDLVFLLCRWPTQSVFKAASGIQGAGLAAGDPGGESSITETVWGRKTHPRSLFHWGSYPGAEGNNLLGAF